MRSFSFHFDTKEGVNKISLKMYKEQDTESVEDKFFLPRDDAGGEKI